VRELDERLGFGELIAQHLTDSRRGKNTQLPLADLLRRSVHSRIAAAAVQLGKRLPGGKAAARQRPQRRRLGNTALAGQGSRVPGLTGNPG
jgi:hypothetical protein